MESEFHCRTQKTLRPSPVLCQINLVHKLPIYFFKNYLILFFHLWLGLPKHLFLSSVFHLYGSIFIYPVSANTSHRSHLPSFDYSDNISE
jgi:hypothetical protein